MSALYPVARFLYVPRSRAFTLSLKSPSALLSSLCTDMYFLCFTNGIFVSGVIFSFLSENLTFFSSATALTFSILSASLSLSYSKTSMPLFESSVFTSVSISLGTTAAFTSSNSTALSGFASNIFTGMSTTSLIMSLISCACASVALKPYPASLFFMFSGVGLEHASSMAYPTESIAMK